MRVNYLLCLIFLLSFLGVQAQVPEFAPHRPATLIQDAERSGANFQTTSLLEIKGTEATVASDPVLKRALSEGTLLNLKKKALTSFNQNPASAMKL